MQLSRRKITDTTLEISLGESGLDQFSAHNDFIGLRTTFGENSEESQQNIRNSYTSKSSEILQCVVGVNRRQSVLPSSSPKCRLIYLVDEGTWIILHVRVISQNALVVGSTAAITLHFTFDKSYLHVQNTNCIFLSVNSFIIHFTDYTLNSRCFYSR